MNARENNIEDEKSYPLYTSPKPSQDIFDFQPLLRQMLFNEADFRTPEKNISSYKAQRAVTELRHRTRTPSIRRQRGQSTSGSGLKRALTSLPSLDQTQSPATSGWQQSRLYKVIVVGEVNTGKSAIVRRFVHNFFGTGDYRSTLGVDFHLKLIPYSDELEIRLQLWDIAGQERFCNMTRAYYKGAVAAFIVCDLSNASTFEAVKKWKNDVDSKCSSPDGNPISTVLIFNKSDLPKDPKFPSEEKLSDFVRQFGFLPQWFVTSAKTGAGIQEAVDFMIRHLMVVDTWSCPQECKKESPIHQVERSNERGFKLKSHHSRPVNSAKDKRPIHFCAC